MVRAHLEPHPGELPGCLQTRALAADCISTEPKDTEGIRAKLKPLVNLQVLTETQPGLFTLTPQRS